MATEEVMLFRTNAEILQLVVEGRNMSNSIVYGLWDRSEINVQREKF